METSLLEESPARKTELEAYGLIWPSDDEIWIERQFIRSGGFITVEGERHGRGLAHHFKRLQELLWPEKVWHRWNDLFLEELVRTRILGVMGPANSGKTHEAACWALCNYFVWPATATILVSSTDIRSLELRVWGEIKKYWNKAREVWPDCPGHLIESKQMIVTDDKSAAGRDFRNGIIGIPCVVGGEFVGVSKFVGCKNERIILIADEASFMGKAFMDSVANLNKNKGFSIVGMGNPKDTEDSLGILCEPHPDIGGYEGMDIAVKTRVYPTRFHKGACIQFIGTDSPNFDVADGQVEPYPFLIGRQEIAQDLLYYGRDSLQFSMMNLGVMPRGVMAKRVINRMMVEQGRAYEEAKWDNAKTTLVAGLDASYSTIGGDRTVLVFVRFGKGAEGSPILSVDEPTITIPINPKISRTPEDQIALKCRELCEDRGVPPGRFFFDSTGRGTLVSALGRVWSSSVVPIEFGGPPTNRLVSDVIRVTAKDHFSKFVTELWFMARYAIEARQVRQITKDIVDEGIMREYGSNKGKLEVEVKEITRKRMGRSPDTFDAFVAAIEGCRRLGFTIQKLAALDDENRKAAKAAILDMVYAARSYRKKHSLRFSS